MKIKIRYNLPVEKEIELTPLEYCALRVNTNLRKDIFPEGSFARDIILDKDARNELDDFFDNYERKSQKPLDKSIEM